MKHRPVIGLACALALLACTPQAPATVQPADPTEQPAHAAVPPAAATQSEPAATDAPLLVDGVFIDAGACPGEGCYLKGPIKAREAINLLQDQQSDSPVLGTIEPDEWVEILGTEDRFVPLSGTDRATGETVYRMGYEGEGCFDLWTKRGLSSWCDDDGDLSNDNVIWAQPVESADRSLGFWTQVKRANAQVGWLDEESIRLFACTGYQDRDDDCPPLP
jgi:hypothetical protein